MGIEHRSCPQKCFADFIEIKECLAVVEHEMVSITKFVQGNGRDGLPVRMDRLEQSVSVWKRISWILFTAAITAMVGILVQVLR